MNYPKRAHTEIGSADTFRSYTSFGADIDLRDTDPGFTGLPGQVKRYPRQVLYFGGAVVVQGIDGVNVILDAAGVGIPRAYQVSKIISSGTTATVVEVAW